jgi:hypothetical protein
MSLFINDLNHTLTGDGDLLYGLYVNLPKNILSFPWKLHQLLDTVEREGCEFIISWLPDGQSFKVHDQEGFVDQILPRHFKLTKYKSFQRQLNIYGFERITDKTSPSRGGYSHTYFVRGEPNQCVKMIRRSTKGVGKSRKTKNTRPSPLSSSDQVSRLHLYPPQEANHNIVVVEGESSIMAQEKRMPNRRRVQSSSNLRDGDMVMFHDKHFFFVDDRSDQQSPPLELQYQQEQKQMLPYKE